MALKVPDLNQHGFDIIESRVKAVLRSLDRLMMHIDFLEDVARLLVALYDHIEKRIRLEDSQSHVRHLMVELCHSLEPRVSRVQKSVLSNPEENLINSLFTQQDLGCRL